MNFLVFAAWGAYLTSMGRYLGNIGLGGNIGYFYSVQGVVSLLMPALMGIIADKWVQAQRLLGICHLVAGLFMVAIAAYGYEAGLGAEFSTIFPLYTISVAFYMPTIALSNSVAYTGLKKEGLDTVKVFPSIRIWGTIGFILSMWFVDLLGFQSNQNQFMVSGMASILLFFYSFTLPKCEISKENTSSKTLWQALGLDAFKLFKRYDMAVFFIFSMLLGVCLQITNGYANPFISSFSVFREYENSFGVQHANILISLSQISETFCILLIPFFLKRYGIKAVMLTSMLAWVLRFGLFGLGDPGEGLWMLIASMLIYGVAFDFFNISGSLFVDQQTPAALRSSAQGLFMLMTNGIGATIGTIAAQKIINAYTHNYYTVGDDIYTVGDWQSCWFIFAGYAFVVAILFTLIFRPKKVENTEL